MPGPSASSRTIAGPASAPRRATTRLPTLEALRSFVTRRNPEDATLAGFERSVRAWGRASEYVHLTPEQYAMLMSR